VAIKSIDVALLENQED